MFDSYRVTACLKFSIFRSHDSQGHMNSKWSEVSTLQHVQGLCMQNYKFWNFVITNFVITNFDFYVLWPQKSKFDLSQKLWKRANVLTLLGLCMQNYNFFIFMSHNLEGVNCCYHPQGLGFSISLKIAC